jgi:hypothetical protein
MLKAQKQPYNSVWISADSQQELGETFIRFQEYYESPNKKFRNQTFTLGAVKQWYSIQYGADLYSDLWVGFNFPSYVLDPFKKGLFDPLTDLEKQLIDLLKYRNDKFYIIGAQNKSVLRHELAHTLYDSSEKYRTLINNYIKKHNKKFNKVFTYLFKKGYCKTVIKDEIQAYITDNDDEFILNNLDINLIVGINKIYKKFKDKSKPDAQ